MERKYITYWVIVCFAAWCVAMLQGYVLEYARRKGEERSGEVELVETDEFRALKADKEWLEAIGGFAGENGFEFAEVLTYYMLEHDFVLEGKKTELHEREVFLEKLSEMKKNRAKDWEGVCTAYSAIFEDVKYFPIPASSTEYPINVSFADGWGSERYYEEVLHLHEGTDVMTEHERGYVPIVSMTDGIVENVGWLELGGYRIGIRSEHGGYFYYAHLYKYSKNFKIGDTVKAGELIGFMGDSGYGRTEGTVGNFAVHLHMGIYIKTKNHDELAVNPFFVLSYMSKCRILYNMQGK